MTTYTIKPYEHGAVPMNRVVNCQYFDIASSAMFMMCDSTLVKFDLGTTPERKQNYMSGWCAGECDFY